MDIFFASLLVFLILLVTLSFHFLFYGQNARSNINNLPPGTTGFPVVGESLEFLSTGRKGHPEKFIFNRIAKYSSYIFRTSLFGYPITVFCGAAANKFLFSNENKLVQAWWPNHLHKIFFATQTSYEEEDIRMRKVLASTLKPEALQRYIGIMDGFAQQHFATDWENKDQVVVHPLTKRYTFRLACRLLVSVEDPSHVAKFEDSFGPLVAGIFSIPIDLPGTRFNRAIKASNFLRTEMVAIVKQRKLDLAEEKASPTQDTLSHMLLTSDENGKFMHEAAVAAKIMGLLDAGKDTSSSACTSIVMFLADLPEVYEGVYKEQMAIANSKAPGELLNWNDILKMKYSWNVAREAMRLASPTQGTFREAIDDFTYNGFSIPKGSKIHWNAHSTHMNAEFFPEPLKFDPSRFEGSGPAPYTFVPFGGGPRMCPGKGYARLVILVFMHHMVRRFNWEKIVPDEKILVDPQPYPEKGLPVHLYPHKA